MQTRIVDDIEGYELCGEHARLIPVVADSNKERKAVSTALACIQSVKEFGHVLLDSVGAPARKTSRIECYTEVTTTGRKELPKNSRPDGLIVIRTGKRQWAAIVEAKIGTQELRPAQIVEYIDLARLHDVQAIITVSNDFAQLPTHHPVEISKHKLGKLELFHWSWTYLMTQAILQVDNSGIADADQAYILAELVRFLRHDHSGVAGMDRLPRSWPDLCNSVRRGMPLVRSDTAVRDVVNAWHELIRFISLEFSIHVGTAVTVHLSRNHANNAKQRESDDINKLCESSLLEASFDVPDAAARTCLSVNLQTRNAKVWMDLKAPRDRKLPRSCVTWIMNQIKDEEVPDTTHIYAQFAGRTENQMCKFSTLLQDKMAILEAVPGRMPTTFAVMQEVDMAGDLKKNRKIVQRLLELTLGYYSDIGQHLRSWVPTPPQAKREQAAPTLPKREDPKKVRSNADVVAPLDNV